MHRVFAARQALEAIARQLPILDCVQSSPGKSSLLVDEQVVHDAREPGAGLLDPDEVVELVEGSYEEFLKKVLRLGFTTGETPCEAIQAVEVWPDQPLECQRIVVPGSYGQGPLSIAGL